MSIITLITDFGNKDHFVAKIKGDIYSNYNEAKIVDVSNNVSPFNIMEAAYMGLVFLLDHQEENLNFPQPLLLVLSILFF